MVDFCPIQELPWQWSGCMICMMCLAPLQDTFNFRSPTPGCDSRCTLCKRVWFPNDIWSAGIEWQQLRRKDGMQYGFESTLWRQFWSQTGDLLTQMRVSDALTLLSAVAADKDYYTREFLHFYRMALFHTSVHCVVCSGHGSARTRHVDYNAVSCGRDTHLCPLMWHIPHSRFLVMSLVNSHTLHLSNTP